MSKLNKPANIAAAIGLFGLAASALAQTVALTLTDATKDKVQDVTVGDVVALKLPTAVDGGYSWSIASAPDVVEARPSIRASGGGGAGHAVGGPGTTTFFLKATTPGLHVVNLAEGRAWMKDSPPAETFAFTLRAKAAETVP